MLLEAFFGCGSIFCAVCLFEQTRGKGLSAPTILSRCASSFLTGRLGCRSDQQGRRLALLVLALLLTHPLLLMGLTLELALLQAQALLLLPELAPALIEQR